MKHWLVKQEPDDYPFGRLMADGRTDWTGVRNYQARNFLREMRVGDPVLYYHSVEEKSVVGLARVSKAAFPDPTMDGEQARCGWLAVEIQAERAFERPVPLATIKSDSVLRDLPLIRQLRLSVMPVSAAQFRRILQLGRCAIG